MNIIWMKSWKNATHELRRLLEQAEGISRSQFCEPDFKVAGFEQPPDASAVAPALMSI